MSGDTESGDRGEARAGAGLSCEGLARQLPAIYGRIEQLEAEASPEERESPLGVALGPLHAAYRQLHALEDLILRTPPVTIPDCAALALVSARALDDISIDPRCSDIIATIQRNMFTITQVCARAASVPLPDLSFERFGTVFSALSQATSTD